MAEQAVLFSEDVIPLGDLKVNPGKIVRQVRQTRRPVLVTSHGRGEAVVQALEDYEASQEERAFMRAVVEGLSDIETGHTLTLDQLQARLGITDE